MRLLKMNLFVFILFFFSLDAKAINSSCQTSIINILTDSNIDIQFEINHNNILSCGEAISLLSVDLKYKLLLILKEYKKQYSVGDVVTCKDLPEMVKFLSYDKTIQLITFFMNNGCLSEYTIEEEDLLFDDLIYKLKLDLELAKYRRLITLE